MGVSVIPGDASLIKWLICLLALAEGPRPKGCLPTSTSRLNIALLYSLNVSRRDDNCYLPRFKMFAMIHDLELLSMGASII